MPKKLLAGMTSKQMEALFPNDPLASARGKQLSKWVYRKFAPSIAEMTDIPAEARNRLSEEYVVQPLQVVRHLKSKDGVDKLLVHSGDEQGFECVLLPYEKRVSCCISTQVGCAMGCTFCATGLGGFDRNLSAGEIVSQYILLQKLSDRRISHVVYMGMGEPLHNYDEVIKSLKLFHEEIGLSYRHITISTVGLVPQIKKLAKENLPIHLAISLHSPLDAVRSQLIPANKRWGIAELLDACREFTRTTGRKLTFEYLLIEKVTDTPEQAEKLAKLLKGLPCLINLIPFNYVVTGQNYKRPSTARVSAFRNILKSKGMNVTQRVERGHKISAACGQLKGLHDGKYAKRRSSLELSLLQSH